MTYTKAIDYVRDILIYPKYIAPKDEQKKIEILDVQDKIACAKLTSFWGIDYLLLSFHDEKWMIMKIVSWHKF